MYKVVIWIIMLHLSMGSASEFFNLTLTMPNIHKAMSNESIYIPMKLPNDEELYIVDFHSIYNRQKVRFITTYLCSRPYSIREKFWFVYQPCYNMDRSMIIYEWYYNIPAIQWPKDAGFRVGRNTSYRYVVIHIQYFSSGINDVYGQRITISRRRPKYKIGMYKIVTNLDEFSCRYRLSLMQIFSIRFYSNYEGRSISLYRVRNNQLQSIIKGNLHWSQTFYQLENSIDMQMNDYLIGTCIYENRSITQTEYSNRDVICQITAMFWVKQEDEMSRERCWNNDYSRVVERFLPVDVGIPPETLFDINPTYPKLSPDEWAIMNEEISSSTSKSMNNSTNILFLTYVKADRRQEIIRLAKNHKLLFIVSIWGLALSIGFLILFIIIIQSLGGERSSLSRWLTRRRFQQYDQDDNIENVPLTEKHRWASASEESDLSDDEVFHTTDSQNVVPKN